MLFQRILWRWSLAVLEDALSGVTERLLSLRDNSVQSDVSFQRCWGFA